MIFGNDTQSCVSHQVMDAVLEANTGYSNSYGKDEWSQQAIVDIGKVFDCDVDVFFVATGNLAFNPEEQRIEFCDQIDRFYTKT